MPETLAISRAAFMNQMDVFCPQVTHRLIVVQVYKQRLMIESPVGAFFQFKKPPYLFSCSYYKVQLEANSILASFYFSSLLDHFLVINAILHIVFLFNKG